MAAEFSNQEKRSGCSRRSVYITNPSGFPQRLLVPGPAGPAQGAAADRTAAFLLPRAGVDQSLPYMALGTLPPDSAVAADRHHFRRQAAVEDRVPLGRHVWRLGGKVVEAGKDLPPRTVGTAHPLLHLWENGGSPGVALGAPPPDLAHGPRRHLPGRQGGVPLRVPLGRQLWRGIRQGIFPRHHQPPRADRTSAAGQPGIDGRLPGMAPFAEPPRRAVAPRQNVGRLPRCVFPQVPLGGQRRIQGGKVVTLSHPPARAVGAARPAGPTVDWACQVWPFSQRHHIFR